MGALKYGIWDVNAWRLLIVDGANDDVGLYASLALDDSGVASVSYYDRTNGDLKLIYANEQGWTAQTVDGAGDVGLYSSVSLDAGGYPCISYIDAGNDHLKYTCWRAGGWQYWTVDGSEDMGAFCSLALDPVNGRPHISYYDRIAADLRHATQARGSWEIDLVDGEGDVGYSASVGLAPESGHARISYYDRHPRYDLKVASWDGAGWAIEVVEAVGDVGSHSSLAIGSSGRAHIAYSDGTNGSLRYAVSSESGWHGQTVASGLGVGEHASLALDWQEQPRIADYDSSRRALIYAPRDGVAWQIGTVDQSADVGRYASLALDGAGFPRIAYYDEANGDLKYADWIGTSWRTQVVDSAGDVGMYATLALDRSGSPHVAYLDKKALDLKYAFWDGAEWQVQTVDGGGRVGLYASIALDGHDNPRIAYYDESQATLKLAIWDGRAWSIQTVVGAGDVGRHASLAADSRGLLQVAYCEYLGPAWPGVIRNACLAVLAMVLVPILASRLMRALYGLDSLSDAYAHLHRSVFGLSGMRPLLLVREGRLATDGDEPAARLGGPSNLIAYNDSAVVAEQGGRLTRVLGPGVHRLKAFERIWASLDLRPQSRRFRLLAMTVEGIWVVCKGEVAFRILGGSKAPTDKMPYPYTDKAVVRAAMATWVREAGDDIEPDSEPWKVKWPARIVGGEKGGPSALDRPPIAEGARRSPGVVGLTERILRDLVSRYRLDDLVVPQRPGSRQPRQVIRDELTRRLRPAAADVGVEIIRVELDEFEVDERVSDQWIKAWQAEWQRDAMLVQAEGEAQLATIDAAQTRAQVQMILTLVERLQPLVKVREQAAVYEVAVRLVETLRWMSFDPVTRAFLPPEALRSLQDLEDSLSTGQAYAQSGAN